MSWEEQTRRRCSRLGLAILAVGAALIVVGGTPSLFTGRRLGYHWYYPDIISYG